MKLFFIISALIHVLFLVTFWIYGVRKPDVKVYTKLLLKIGAVEHYRPINKRETSVEKWDGNVGQVGSRHIPLPHSITGRILEAENVVPKRKVSYAESVEETLVFDSEYVSPLNKVTIEEALEPLNPISGFEDLNQDGTQIPEDNVDKNSVIDNFQGNVWHLSWLNMEGRHIVSSPEIKLDDFVFDVDRLLDTVIRVAISPEGNVLNVDLLPPGSGDLKLDRYIYSRTFEIIMEPIPVSDGIEEAELRLLFTGKWK